MSTVEPTSLDLLKAVLDPIRLAVLGAGVGQAVSMSAIESQTGAPRKDIAEAIGWLRNAGLVDTEGRVMLDALRVIAVELPSDRTDPRSISGPWTREEAEVLARFFDGDRLRSVPSNFTKRRLVLERIVQVFDPGVRYPERDVNFRLQLVFADYAAIRRYLVDEGFMDRADGVYWRTGGRHETGSARESVSVPVGSISTDMNDVELRPYEHSMVSDLVEAANHPEINRFMNDRFPNPYTAEDASEWISFTIGEPEPLNYAVYADGELVGGVGASTIGLERTGTFEIGWWLTPSHWSRGITTAGARALVDELFENRGAMTLWAPVMGPNAASARVAANIGMVLEGNRKSVFLKGGVRHDQLDFGLTRSRWASS